MDRRLRQIVEDVSLRYRLRCRQRCRQRRIEIYLEESGRSHRLAVALSRLVADRKPRALVDSKEGVRRRPFMPDWRGNGAIGKVEDDFLRCLLPGLEVAAPLLYQFPIGPANAFSLRIGRRAQGERLRLPTVG